MIEIFKFFYWAIGIINFIVAFFVLFKSRQKLVKGLFFVLIMVLNGWLISNYIAFFTGFSNVTIIAGRFAFAFGALIVPAFLLFSLFFPFKSKISSIVKFLLIVPPIIIVFMSFGPYFFYEVEEVLPGVIRPVYGKYFNIFSIYILFNVIFAYTILIKKFSKSKSIQRVKIRYIIVGFGAAVLIGFSADIVIPYLGDIFNRIEGLFGPLGTIFITSAFAYSILRYRLMDIKLVIRRGLVYFFIDDYCIFSIYLFTNYYPKISYRAV